MLRTMFGMGGSEILVILIVALLFLGPDKLPEAAKQISKGIRDIKKQSRVLQRTIEDDEHIGGAIRDLKSALRGEDEPVRPPVRAQAAQAAAMIALPEPAAETPSMVAQPALMDAATLAAHDAAHVGAALDAAAAVPVAAAAAAEHATASETPAAPSLRMPATAGEADEGAPVSSAADDAALAALVKPAPNTIARAPVVRAAATPAETPPPAESTEPTESEPKHG